MVGALNAAMKMQSKKEYIHASAANKQALAHYTWLEQQTVSLKGEVKKTQQFQVRIGPDGQQQKTGLNPQPAPQPSGGRIKRRIVEKKTDEFQAYGQQIGEWGQQAVRRADSKFYVSTRVVRLEGVLS
jgi:hypothetical protein